MARLRTKFTVIRLLALGAALAGSPAAAATPPPPPARCEQLKLNACARAAAGFLNCQAKAVGAGVAAAAACTERATRRLGATFTRVERRRVCTFLGEQGAIAATLSTLATELALATGPGPSRCGRRKLLAAGQRARLALLAQARHARAPELAGLGSGLAQAAAKFDVALVSAEALGDCAGPGDGTTLAGRVDAATAEIVDAVRGTLVALASQSGRKIGAAVRAQVIASPEASYRSTLLRQFDSVTLEYELMWGNLEWTRGQYSFAAVNTTVAFAEQNGMTIKGAPLVWHLILPPWVNEAMTPAQLQLAVDERIDTLVGTYAGRIHTWDVVNEAAQDGYGAFRESIFYRKLGPDYIRRAFVRTRTADPNATLFYNDFLAEGLNGKSDFIYALVVDLLAQGTPIDGVGFQMHLGGGFGAIPSKESVVQNLQRFAALGLRVRLSEIDVQTSGFAGDASAKRAAQRAVYRDLVAACLEVPACESITFWGFTDKYSWISDYLAVPDEPLPFDAAYQAKAPFFGIRDALRGFPAP